MKGTIRTILVDPCDDSRHEIQSALGGVAMLRLEAALASFEPGPLARQESAGRLLVVVMDADPARALELIRSVLQGDPGAAILPASRGRDHELILKAMRAGAREFLMLPALPADWIGAVGRLFPAGQAQGDADRRGSQVVAVAGAMGGVGSTTLAVNLATTLAAHPGHTVALPDFDLVMGSVDACLDLVPDHTLLDVSQNIDRLDQTLLARSLTRHASGVWVLPPPASLQDVARIDPESLRRLVGMLKSSFNSVIIDTSKGLQASDFVAYEEAGTIMLVVQLDLICLRNSARLLDLFRQCDGLYEKVRVLANRVGSSDNDVGLKKAEDALGCPVTWRMPNASKVLNAARIKGVTIEEEAEGCRAHKALQEIAQAFLPAPSPPADARPRKGRFAAFF